MGKKITLARLTAAFFTMSVLMLFFCIPIGDEKYKNRVQEFCLRARTVQPKSPKGLVFYYKWGSLRYAANAALVCMKVRK